MSFFLTCALLGGSVLVIQLVLGAIGVGEDADGHHHIGGDGLHGGLDLLSVRALAAATAAFGVGGMIAVRAGFGVVGGVLLGAVLGLGAAYAVAWAMRTMLRLESDGTLRIENAIGSSAQVYLSIPAAKQGAGKVHLTVQGRIVELAAVTSHGEPLPTGASVVVIDVVGTDMVEVAPEEATSLSEVLNAAP